MRDQRCGQVPIRPAFAVALQSRLNLFFRDLSARDLLALLRRKSLRDPLTQPRRGRSFHPRPSAKCEIMITQPLKQEFEMSLNAAWPNRDIAYREEEYSRITEPEIAQI
jgi:hypothetical protein